MNFTDWNGGDRPVAEDVSVIVKHRNGQISYFKPAGLFDWHWQEDEQMAEWDIVGWTQM